MERQDEEGCWVSKTSPPLYGTVYNATTDDCSRVDNLYPTFVLTRVNLPEATVQVAGTTMDRQFFRFASTCALPVLLCGRFLVGLVMRRQFDCQSPLSDLMVERVCHFQFDEDDGTVACATVGNDT